MPLTEANSLTTIWNSNAVRKTLLLPRRQKGLFLACYCCLITIQVSQLKMLRYSPQLNKVLLKSMKASRWFWNAGCVQSFWTDICHLLSCEKPRDLQLSVSTGHNDFTFSSAVLNLAFLWASDIIRFLVWFSSRIIILWCISWRDSRSCSSLAVRLWSFRPLTAAMQTQTAIRKTTFIAKTISQ